jgi:hypothetical protein
MCDGYSGCSCDIMCYGYTACSCDLTCYGYIACSCDVACYGDTACSCNAICYGYIACSCDLTCYNQSGIVIYEFEGIGWDLDSIIIDLNNKWNWVSVYLYQPPGLDGSFGLVPKKEQLEASTGINDANKTQIEQTNDMLP